MMSKMDKANLLGKAGIITKGATHWTKGMGMVRCFGMMELLIKGSGSVDRNMGMES